ncbi:MAG: beta-Ala-His dipeptidase [Oscillospiraceae bacterium]|nr:beta-Ala-His dipeptidase [Oscillospiraceae bacterium]
MLKTILSGETCAACRNCCIFEEQSAWELPTFPEAAIRRLKNAPQYKIKEENGRYRITLPYDDTHTAKPCPFLDAESGCTLPAEEKPFACKLWPVRVMPDSEGRPALTLYRGCPGVAAEQTPALYALLDSGLRARIFSELSLDPSLMLPYHPNYIYLERRNMMQYPKPEAVFRYFSEIAAIPHGSGNTAGIRGWALQTAARLSLDAHADETGNVIIRKAASPGYETHPRVMLQGHLDMVCAKLPDCSKNMETEGLDLIWGEEYLTADGTTLGGDDGIAVAYAFALLEADDIPHPPLTVLLTVDEETGMDGASGLAPEELDGQYLINLDSEDEGIFTVGCAGGVRSHLCYPVSFSPAEGALLRLHLSGLTGGHSGTEIDKPRLNANTAMLRMLRAVPVPFRLIAWNGGVRDNVIPTECSVSLCCMNGSEQAVLRAIQNTAEEIRSETPDDSSFQVTSECGAVTDESALTEDATAALLRELSKLPNGVQKMNDTLHMPETSLNLGIFSLGADGMQVDALIRSGVNEEKRLLAGQLAAAVTEAGGTASESGEYPAWEYQPDTALERTAVRVFQELYGKAPVVQTIHAGLECGILSAKAPLMQCISIGPDLPDIHTPRERLSIPSARRTWEFLCALLKAL